MNPATATVADDGVASDPFCSKCEPHAWPLPCWVGGCTQNTTTTATLENENSLGSPLFSAQIESGHCMHLSQTSIARSNLQFHCPTQLLKPAQNRVHHTLLPRKIATVIYCIWCQNELLHLVANRNFSISAFCKDQSLQCVRNLSNGGPIERTLTWNFTLICFFLERQFHRPHAVCVCFFGSPPTGHEAPPCELKACTKKFLTLCSSQEVYTFRYRP